MQVPGLFEGDEYTVLMTGCKEGSQREGLMLDSSEELYKWFTQQVWIGQQLAKTSWGLGMPLPLSPQHRYHTTEQCKTINTCFVSFVFFFTEIYKAFEILWYFAVQSTILGV